MQLNTHNIIHLTVCRFVYSPEKASKWLYTDLYDVFIVIYIVNKNIIVIEYHLAPVFYIWV